MKRLIIIILLSAVATFSQNVSPQFSELKGMEDQSGNTHLFYRIYTSGFGTMGFYYSNNIWRIEPSSGIDTFFLGDGGFADLFDEVNDYDFWGNNYRKYIYAGTHIYIEPTPEVYRYDQIDPIFISPIWGGSKNIELSRQDTNLIIVSFNNGFNYRSTDWGNNWDSISIGYEILSLSPFDDNIIFASQVLSLLKSTDGGNTFYTVDTSKIYSVNFIYDNDRLHIYALDRRLGSHLVVSDNKGEPFSWQTKYSSDSKIYISIDNSNSGTVYLADKKNIYLSTDYGDNFNLYRSLENDIVGIYKKPNSDKLYAATKYKIYEITPISIQVIKSLLIPDEILNFYPLTIGNKWVYDKTTVAYDPYPQYSHQILVKEVLRDSMAQNGKHYYYLRDETVWEEDVLERIDSSEGKVYKYLEDPGLPENEYLLDDLLAEVGDTVNSYRMGYHPGSHTTVLDEITFVKWELIKPKKVYEQYILHPPVYSLTQDIGLDSIYSYFDFGETWIVLKGCIIDGIVYGDTTVVSVEDETPNLPTEFSLSQNYPNPFNPSTTIRFTISELRFTILKVYDILGNEIATLVNEEKPAGSYEVEFNAERLTSGIYFYRLQAGNFIETMKMVILK